MTKVAGRSEVPSSVFAFLLLWELQQYQSLLKKPSGHTCHLLPTSQPLTQTWWPGFDQRKLGFHHVVHDPK